MTHYLRIVRAIMLKGAALQNLDYDTVALVAADAVRDDDRGDALPPHARLTRGDEGQGDKARSSDLPCRQILDLDAVTILDDFGDPSPVTMLVIALVAENADRA